MVLRIIAEGYTREATPIGRLLISEEPRLRKEAKKFRMFSGS